MMTDTDELTAAVDRAYASWVDLKVRLSNPQGTFDNAGRWYPDDAERCDCCSDIRGPSRAYPYSLMKHCRSVEHVANRFGVPATALRRKIARERTQHEEARR